MRTPGDPEVCWCQVFRHPREDWDARPVEQNRADLEALVSGATRAGARRVRRRGTGGLGVGGAARRDDPDRDLASSSRRPAATRTSPGAGWSPASWCREAARGPRPPRPGCSGRCRRARARAGCRRPGGLPAGPCPGPGDRRRHAVLRHGPALRRPRLRDGRARRSVRDAAATRDAAASVLTSRARLVPRPGTFAPVGSLGGRIDSGGPDQQRRTPCDASSSRLRLRRSSYFP